MDVYDERRRQSATRLIDIVEAAVKSGIEIPKGVVEGLNVAMREDARSAANLNPQRFSEKQKINVNSTVTQPQTVTIVNDLKEVKHGSSRTRYLVCKGSRGSKKSKTTALRLIVNLMSHPEAYALPCDPALRPISPRLVLC